MIYVNSRDGILHLFCRYQGASGVMDKKYPVALGGEEQPTPEGKFHIVRKIVMPEAYYVDISPEEVGKFGIACMELNIAYKNRPIGIHGCDPNKPLSKQSSGGCILMLEPDLIEVFNWVEKGQAVIIWNGRFKESQLRDIPNYNRIRKWPPKRA